MMRLYFFIAVFFISLTVANKAKSTPLQVGDKVPENLVLYTGMGNSYKFSKVAASQPSLIVFYRGSWCPYGVKQLKELRLIDLELTRMGFQVFALSPDQPSYLKRMADKIEGSFVLLSDRGGLAQRAFGVARRTDPEFVEELKKNGVFLREITGLIQVELPMYALFLTDSRGVIQFSYTNEDHVKTLEMTRILEEAKRIHGIEQVR